MRITDPKIIKSLLKSNRISTKNKKEIQDALVKQPIIYKKQQKALTGTSSEDALYNLLFPIYGDYRNGGELICELRAVKGRGYRIDVALPNWKIACEIDGITGHAMLESGALNKDGFKRDREKSLILTACDWHVISCVRSHITKEPNLILDAIELLTSTRTKKEINIDISTNKTPFVIHE